MNQRPDGTGVATQVAIYSTEFLELRFCRQLNHSTPTVIAVTEPQRRAEARKVGRHARQSLDGPARLEAEARLISHLLALDVFAVSSVGLFLAHDGEPDLTPLIEALWNRDATVALPVLRDDPEDYSMRFMPWRNGDTLGSGRYGIPVPPKAEVISPETLLVSMVGFDTDGNRIGRGAGYFDRYLATYVGNVVGVAFETQKLDAVPIDTHDVAMPVVVTEFGVRFTDRVPL